MNVFLRASATILGLAVPLAATDLLAQEAAGPACLRDTSWGEVIAPYNQYMEFDVISQFDGKSIVAVEFYPLEGFYAKRFGFFLHNGACVEEAYIVGAFASVNQFTPVEDLPADAEIRFNQDLYTMTSHASLDVSTEAPSYEEARDLALELLN